MQEFMAFDMNEIKNRSLDELKESGKYHSEQVYRMALYHLARADMLNDLIREAENEETYDSAYHMKYGIALIGLAFQSYNEKDDDNEQNP